MERLSFFFILATIASGCDSGGTELSPANDHLKNFFAVDNSLLTYRWVHKQNGSPDSMYIFSHVGESEETSIDGLSPIDLYAISDTGHLWSVQDKYYVSDSLVIRYGSDFSSAAERIVLLQDTLREGKKWRAAEAYLSSDSVAVRIDAEVDAYYSAIHIANNDYVDVYRVTYRPTPMQATTDAAMRSGARHVYYYARGIGKVLELVYSRDTLLLWKNELDLER